MMECTEKVYNLINSILIYDCYIKLFITFGVRSSKIYYTLFDLK